MLCVAKYLEGHLFFGIIYSWLIGLPFLAITILKPEK